MNSVTRLYNRLSPEERFRLILAASHRRDEAERERLIRASAKVTHAVADYNPYAHALYELALYSFLELLDLAAQYLELILQADLPEYREENPTAEAGAAEDDAPPSIGERRFRLALARGYEFKVRMEAWQRFCDRQTIPPFLLWEDLPGFRRVQEAAALSRDAAFAEEGYVQWRNGIRPAGEPRIPQSPLRNECLDADLDTAFRDRARWWGAPN